MTTKTGENTKEPLYCSFCAKSQHEVRKLIAGPSVFICNECIDLCTDIIEEEGKGLLVRSPDDVPTPKQIFDVAAKILNERGLLTKKRQSIPGFSTRKLKFDYVSPLYDLQNQSDLNHFITNMQVKQQFFGQGAALATVNIFEAQKFLTDKLNLPRKLFSSDEEIRQFLQQLGQAQQAAQLPQPSPSTTAGQVKFPENQGVTI